MYATLAALYDDNPYGDRFWYIPYKGNEEELKALEKDLELTDGVYGLENDICEYEVDGYTTQNTDDEKNYKLRGKLLWKEGFKQTVEQMAFRNIGNMFRNPCQDGNF